MVMVAIWDRGQKSLEASREVRQEGDSKSIPRATDSPSGPGAPTFPSVSAQATQQQQESNFQPELETNSSSARTDDSDNDDADEDDKSPGTTCQEANQAVEGKQKHVVVSEAQEEELSEATTRNRPHLSDEDSSDDNDSDEASCQAAGDSSLNNTTHLPPTSVVTPASRHSSEARSQEDFAGVEGSALKQESPTRLLVDVTKGEVRVKQLGQQHQLQQQQQQQPQESLSSSPSTSPSTHSEVQSESVDGTPDSSLDSSTSITSSTTSGSSVSVIKLDTRITSDHHNQVRPTSTTGGDISEDKATYWEARERDVSNRNQSNNRGSDINSSPYVQEVLGVHRPAGVLDGTASHTWVTPSEEDYYKQTREHQCSSNREAPPKFGTPEIREEGDYNFYSSDDRVYSRSRPLELRDRTSRGEASFLDDDEEGNGWDGNIRRRRRVSAELDENSCSCTFTLTDDSAEGATATAGSARNLQPQHLQAITSYSGHREEGVTSFSDPDPEEDRYYSNNSNNNHSLQQQQQQQYSSGINNRNSYVRLDDSDNYVPHTAPSGRRRRRHLDDDDDDLEEQARLRSRYQVRFSH